MSYQKLCEFIVFLALFSSEPFVKDAAQPGYPPSLSSDIFHLCCQVSIVSTVGYLAASPFPGISPCWKTYCRSRAGRSMDMSPTITSTTAGIPCGRTKCTSSLYLCRVRVMLLMTLIRAVVTITTLSTASRWVPCGCNRLYHLSSHHKGALSLDVFLD